MQRLVSTDLKNSTVPAYLPPKACLPSTKGNRPPSWWRNVAETSMTGDRDSHRWWGRQTACVPAVEHPPRTSLCFNNPPKNAWSGSGRDKTQDKPRLRENLQNAFFTTVKVMNDAGTLGSYSRLEETEELTAAGAPGGRLHRHVGSVGQMGRSD